MDRTRRRSGRAHLFTDEVSAARRNVPILAPSSEFRQGEEILLASKVASVVALALLSFLSAVGGWWPVPASQGSLQ
jgi:hypothetical protein